MIKKKVAIFDIDGTIFRSSLLIKLVDALIREGIFNPGVADMYKKAHEDWQNREGGYEMYIKGVVKAIDENIRGVSYSDLRRIAHQVVVENKSRTYRYTRDLVRDLKAKGYYVMAISHSPKLALEGFCKTLGFNKVYGLMYEVDTRGKFTGRFLFPELIFSKDKISPAEVLSFSPNSRLITVVTPSVRFTFVSQSARGLSEFVGTSLTVTSPGFLNSS